MKKLVNSNTRGFTLLELLIVIAIIAILSAILIFVLNPAEALRKGRDSKRISDLNTLNKALAFILIEYQGNFCQSSADLYISLPSDTEPINPGCTAPTGDIMWPGRFNWKATTSTDLFNIGGTGWMKVNFNVISGGSPISALPVDPTNDNDVGTVDCPEKFGDENRPKDHFYVFSCDPLTSTWETNAVLESTAFTRWPSSGGEGTPRARSDGGNNNSFYEVGNNLKLIWWD